MLEIRVDTALDALGQFWPPSTLTPRFAGRLKCEAGGKIRLETVQVATSPIHFDRRLKSEPVLHGLLQDGSSVTLFECLAVNITTSMSSGTQEVAYLPQRALFGLHTAEFDALRLRSFSVEPSSLREWLGFIPYSMTERAGSTPVIEQSKSLQVDVDVGVEGLSISLQAFSLANSSGSSFTVRAQTWLTMRAPAGACARDLVAATFRFFDLIEVLVGSPLSNRRIAGLVVDDDGTEHPVQLIWMSTGSRGDGEVRGFEMLVPYRSIADRWDSVARRWHALDGKRKLALLLLVKSSRGGSGFLEDRFLDAMKAAESYHEALAGAETAEVGASTPCPVASSRATGKGRAGRPPRPRLAERVQALLDRLPADLRARIAPAPFEFARATAGLRNEIAHGASGEWTRCFRGVQTHFATVRVLGMLRAILLLDLGLTGAEVASAMQRDARFMWAIEHPLPCDACEGGCEMRIPRQN